MGEPSVKVRVEQGCIHVNHVHIEHQSEDAILLVVDTRAKRPVIHSFGSCDNSRTVYLSKDECTLKAEETERPTEISIELDSREWHVIANTGRYSVLIGLFRWAKSNDLRLAWSDEE